MDDRAERERQAATETKALTKDEHLERHRDLLPRWPSDRVVALLVFAGLAIGLAATAFVGGEQPWLVISMVPAAAAAWFQKIAGHVKAWRSDGVERAFIMESTAVSFYVLSAVLSGTLLLQAAGVVDRIDGSFLFLAPLLVDTAVRSSRQRRFA